MPQLDTIFIFMTHVWVWLILFLLVQKTKTLLITKTPKILPSTQNRKPMLTLPWT